jgi:single-stranded-DNA-specific exonuclease
MTKSASINVHSTQTADKVNLKSKHQVSYKILDVGAGSLVENLLSNRGIKNREDQELFLNPDYNLGTHDPFLMKDMEKSVNRLMEAINKGEKVCIYTDYDADGIPGGVVFHDFFKKISYTNVMFYIPHRHKEGFGLNSDAVTKIANDGAKLLITVDCGISDVDEVAHANNLGMDVIITDHHLPHETIPSAYAILNPKQEGCKYPEKMLCGSGVVYKFIQALYIRGVADFDWEKKHGIKIGMEKWSLDMVGIATLSDMVPLLGENRTLAYFGLKVLRKSLRVGLRRLFQSLKIDQPNVTEDDIQFLITPRINAASRMADPVVAFELLSTDNPMRATELCKFLDKINTERKTTVAQISKEIKNKHDVQKFIDAPVIVIGNPNWRPALLGLIANNLMREYGKPAFVWGRAEEGDIKGSCRSDGSCNLVDLMTAVEVGVFTESGGHAMSGGFAVSEDAIHFLGDHICKAAEKIFAESAFARPTIEIDQLMSPRDINWKLWEVIEKMAPFGESNRKPLFIFKSATVLNFKKFGKATEHVEIKIAPTLTAISFFSAEDPKFNVKNGQNIDMIATVEKSTFKRTPELRLRIVDIIHNENIENNK